MTSNPKRDRPTVGDRLRAVRRGRRMTQRALARRTGVAEPFLSRIENDRATPSIRTLERLAAGLEVSVGDLLAAPAGQFRPACPVSISGQCIAEIIGLKEKEQKALEVYTSRQLELLRLSNRLIQRGGHEILAAFETILHAMLESRGAVKQSRRSEAKRR